ncbi:MULTISPECIES: hypothetical protein [Streptomyces]|uniref:Uncharacterized protein n=1 Tax=Streptomyces katrae TaxID=68223 RepID=A0ABT7GQJ8_9ACTN|nr:MULTISPECIES: hypothetical protein [Streptomyces]MDK9495872.1 hypothetical protein [Streptomyces katrae]GLX16526.1 hypothetical protein Slala01_01700 [Streptomyces lavendulae subsp. lavendulae]GLX25146.1 hypothetical protein Slala02_09660 [Streptomyces lavendulae subsp. lavendulae]
MANMQINDSVRYLDSSAGAETAALDHPLGEVAFGASGTLGLRSRLLRSADADTAFTMDMPWTTGTCPF